MLDKDLVIAIFDSSVEDSYGDPNYLRELFIERIKAFDSPARRPRSSPRRNPLLSSNPQKEEIIELMEEASLEPQEEDVVELIENGISPEEISKITGVSEETIDSIAEKITNITNRLTDIIQQLERKLRTWAPKRRRRKESSGLWLGRLVPPHAEPDPEPEFVPSDFTVENHGTIYLLRPNTEAAESWIAENLPEDAPRFGNAVVVEHRYIGDIVQGILDDGLSVE